MTMRQCTVAVLVVNTLALAVYDIVAELRGGDEATISRVLFEGAAAYPGLAVAIGGLIGHLFFSQHGVR